MIISEDTIDRTIYSVSQLTSEARAVLEDQFATVWSEGEISNLARPASGHLYFSLKDSGAQVRCAMFQTRNRHLNFALANGQTVLARARVSLYEPRGDFQLIIDALEEQGDGALRRAFEILKQRLAAEGLFDPNNKKPIPTLPQQIGVITSPSGAAIRDIISVLKRRFPAIPVIIYPTSVQGSGAADQIVLALKKANERRECDVLILARGGGSLEDLWSFNEEKVAYAISASKIPIISGVGHETDVTIADFVADLRAPTPSAAAELITPDASEWLKYFIKIGARLQASVRRAVVQQQQKLDWLSKRLRHPRQTLQMLAQRTDELEQRLLRSWQQRHRYEQAQLRELSAKLLRHHPQQQLQLLASQCQHAALQLEQGIKHALHYRGQQLAQLARSLDALSPLATLQRGYAIVTLTNTDKVVYRATELTIGDKVNARLGTGVAVCEVLTLDE